MTLALLRQIILPNQLKTPRPKVRINERRTIIIQSNNMKDETKVIFKTCYFF
jgi:hypothetical protein